MAIRGVCPDCGYKFSLEQALADANARQALLAALEIAPSLSTLVIQYLGLFSPGDRAMRMDALAARLCELASAIKAAEVTHKKQTWAAPMDYWRDALVEIHTKRDTLRLPLTNHNYLFAMVSNKASTAAGKKEQAKENRLRHTPRERGAGAPQKIDQAARRAIATKHLSSLKGESKQ